MKKSISIILILISYSMAYSNTTGPRNLKVSKKKQEWFKEGGWRKGITANPDASVDVNAFYDHYSTHTLLWEKVFDYLRETDLPKLEKGKYTLSGDSLFVIVDEYITQDVKERKFEAHRKYIDLQYIIAGKELIGVAGLDKAILIESYDWKKDIAFYETARGEYRMADNSVFFIFFPADAHQPCVKVDQSVPVKKIVFKILADQ